MTTTKGGLFSLVSKVLVRGEEVSIGGKTVRLRAQLGEGGSAFVFLAEETQSRAGGGNRKTYAVKKSICCDASSLQRSVAEAEMISALPRHPNIVQMYGFSVRQVGVIHEVLVLLELCGRGALPEIMAKRVHEATPFKTSEVLQIFRDACSGINHLHSQHPPIAHRDIKLENILLGEDGVFRLCDFGSCTTEVFDPSLSKKTDKARLEADIEQLTTLPYRAPELIDLNRGVKVNHKVDIWSLGCVLYALCFNKLPFENDARLAILNGKYSIPEGKSKHSDKVMQLITRCLVLDPEMRPSASQLLTDVLDLEEEEFSLKGSKEKTTSEFSLGESHHQEEEFTLAFLDSDPFGGAPRPTHAKRPPTFAFELPPDPFSPDPPSIASRRRQSLRVSRTLIPTGEFSVRVDDSTGKLLVGTGSGIPLFDLSDRSFRKPAAEAKSPIDEDGEAKKKSEPAVLIEDISPPVVKTEKSQIDKKQQEKSEEKTKKNEESVAATGDLLHLDSPTANAKPATSVQDKALMDDWLDMIGGDAKKHQDADEANLALVVATPLDEFSLFETPSQQQQQQTKQEPPRKETLSTTMEDLLNLEDDGWGNTLGALRRQTGAGVMSGGFAPVRHWPIEEETKKKEQEQQIETKTASAIKVVANQLQKDEGAAAKTTSTKDSNRRFAMRIGDPSNIASPPSTSSTPSSTSSSITSESSTGGGGGVHIRKANTSFLTARMQRLDELEGPQGRGWDVQFFVHRCRNLGLGEAIPESPYVKMKHYGRKRKTKPSRTSRDPSFQHLLDFHVFQSQSVGSFVLTVWSAKATAKNVLIGQCDIPVERVLLDCDSTARPFWFPLTARGESIGRVLMTVRVTPCDLGCHCPSQRSIP